MKKPEELTPAELKAEIEALEIQKAATDERLDALLLRRALDACPYQVGDVLINFHGERARIDNISAPHYGGEGYDLEGVYLKKDGSPQGNPGGGSSKLYRHCSFTEYEHWARQDKA